MKGSRTKYYGKWLSVAMLVTVATLYCWWYWVTPFYSDDLVFEAPWFVIPDGMSWSEYNSYRPMRLGLFRVYVLGMFDHDAFRGVNMLTPWFIWLPKWIFNLLTTAAFILAILFGAKVAEIRLTQYNRIALLTLAMLLGLPWVDQMTCVAYTLNYTWPLPFLALYYVLYRHAGRYPLWALLLVALILGAGHEMMGLPLFAATLLTNWGPVDRKLKARRWAAAITAAVPSVALIMVSYFGRLEHTQFYRFFGIGAEYAFSDCVEWFFFDMPFILLAGVAAIVCRKRWKGDRWVTYMLWAVAMFLGESLALNMSGRHVYMFTDFTAVLAFFLIVVRACPRPLMRGRIQAVALWAACLLIASANLVTGAVVIHRLAREEATIVREHYREGSDRQFYPMTPMKDIPLIGFHRYSYLFQYYRCTVWTVDLWDLALGHPSVWPQPIPEALRDFTDADMVKLPGDNNVYDVRGWLVSPDSVTSARFDFRLAPALDVPRVVATPFRRADGRPLYYLTPLHSPILHRYATCITSLTTNHCDFKNNR
ncbi:MAG: DUF6056 family protein [Bacteroidales bacterium]|nr:DUF6056 family protein [Bacteroidales bacterium]